MTSSGDHHSALVWETDSLGPGEEGVLPPQTFLVEERGTRAGWTLHSGHLATRFRGDTRGGLHLEELSLPRGRLALAPADLWRLTVVELETGRPLELYPLASHLREPQPPVAHLSGTCWTLRWEDLPLGEQETVDVVQTWEVVRGDPERLWVRLAALFGADASRYAALLMAPLRLSVATRQMPDAEYVVALGNGWRLLSPGEELAGLAQATLPGGPQNRDLYWPSGFVPAPGRMSLCYPGDLSLQLRALGSWTARAVVMLHDDGSGRPQIVRDHATPGAISFESLDILEEAAVPANDHKPLTSSSIAIAAWHPRTPHLADEVVRSYRRWRERRPRSATSRPWRERRHLPACLRDQVVWWLLDTGGPPPAAAAIREAAAVLRAASGAPPETPVLAAVPSWHRAFLDTTPGRYFPGPVHNIPPTPWDAGTYAPELHDLVTKLRAAPPTLLSHALAPLRSFTNAPGKLASLDEFAATPRADHESGPDEPQGGAREGVITRIFEADGAIWMALGHCENETHGTALGDLDDEPQSPLDDSVGFAVFNAATPKERWALVSRASPEEAARHGHHLLKLREDVRRPTVPGRRDAIRAGDRLSLRRARPFALCPVAVLSSPVAMQELRQRVAAIAAFDQARPGFAGVLLDLRESRASNCRGHRDLHGRPPARDQVQALQNLVLAIRRAGCEGTGPGNIRPFAVFSNLLANTLVEAADLFTYGSSGGDLTCPIPSKATLAGEPCTLFSEIYRGLTRVASRTLPADDDSTHDALVQSFLAGELLTIVGCRPPKPFVATLLKATRQWREFLLDGRPHTLPIVTRLEPAQRDPPYRLLESGASPGRLALLVVNPQRERELAIDFDIDFSDYATTLERGGSYHRDLTEMRTGASSSTTRLPAVTDSFHQVLTVSPCAVAALVIEGRTLPAGQAQLA
ncbi:MAG: hypothetical protein AB1486_32095 [Planctomycetota bacterium]